jgi:hypothetical protein
MPDGFGFDHLPTQGRITHRCIECGWPGFDQTVREADRRRHHDEHERAQRKATERARKASLANARKAKAALARENTRAYRPKGHE